MLTPPMYTLPRSNATERTKKPPLVYKRGLPGRPIRPTPVENAGVPRGLPRHPEAQPGDTPEVSCKFDTGCGLLGEGEAGVPADRLARGERQLQEADGLELARALERAGVLGVQAASAHEAEHGILGRLVVARDEHGRGDRPDRAARERRGEVGVEG